MAPTQINQDFEDLLKAFTQAKVDFVVVGAYALAAHGVPRATGDIDIFVRPTPSNAARIVKALQAFGAPVEAHGVTERDFQSPGAVYQIGLPPRRIDILTEIDGVSFDEATESTLHGTLGSVAVCFIGKDAFVRNKRASGRLKDLADIEALGARTLPDV